MCVSSPCMKKLCCAASAQLGETTSLNGLQICVAKMMPL